MAIHSSEAEERGASGRTDGVREGGGFCGRGVGGQRLKLHHKSHPERKHEVVPPPFSIHLSPPLPLWPGPLLFYSSPSPPFVSVHRECPIDGPGVLYITPSCTSNTKQTIFWLYPSSFHLPLLPRSPWHPSACCKSLSMAKQGSWFKHRRFIGRRKGYMAYIRD